MTDILVKHKFDIPVDHDSVAADWRARGYSCGLFVDPPGQCWEDFVHAVDEVVTVVDGRLELEVAGSVVVADPGDEVFIPARATHSVRNINDGTSRWLYGYA
jgi:quercetin dioxygenase-like cupin family protein